MNQLLDLLDQRTVKITWEVPFGLEQTRGLLQQAAHIPRDILRQTHLALLRLIHTEAIPQLRTFLTSSF